MVIVMVACQPPLHNYNTAIIRRKDGKNKGNFRQCPVEKCPGVRRGRSSKNGAAKSSAVMVAW